MVIGINTATGYVYVANRGSGTVSVLRGTQVVKTLTVGAEPVDIEINPETSQVYVVNYAGQSVTVIDELPDISFLPIMLRNR